jgi:heme oxygenase (mycobilin-producing)
MQPDPVILINAFEVPAQADDRFVEGWERARDFLSTQAGYVSSSLHRSISPDADFRFVNIARWESIEAFQAATSRPEFTGGRLPFRFHASLYEVVR